MKHRRQSDRRSPSSSTTPLVSIVLPCLNEEKTIGMVIREAHQAFTKSPYSFEIIVADNGSTDRSAAIAETLGARVVPVPTRGYGAALCEGIARARGIMIVFGDSDFTYDFREGPNLIARLLAGDSDMVIGTRLKGRIEDGAMPDLHRYVGTPALTRIINLLFNAQLTDSNSGFRAFFRKKFLHWNIRASGMEICSELIIHCLRSGSRIVEVPISLRRDRRDRVPHLSTWRDGTRNLLIILSRAPHLFTYAGTTFLIASVLLGLPSAILGQTKIGPFYVFDHHSMLLAILAGFLGSQSLFYGLLLDSRSEKPLAINAAFLRLNEVVLLKMLSVILMLIVGFVGFLSITWVGHGFSNIDFISTGLSVLYATILVGGVGLNVFIAQVHLRAPLRVG